GVIRDRAARQRVNVALIGPRVAGVRGNAGGSLTADEAYEGGPSVLFDAVILLPCKDEVEQMAHKPAVRDFVADAYAHCKFIGVGVAARPLLDRAGIDPDDGILPITDEATVDEFLEA